ncbi:ATP-dependent DNA helicase PIF1-like [Trifolium pratense]|uniref:ATP-dependent DNA helicase PIF1-like n=1 Tax=Trifolium pratense TaxID=57577 RepID=UPI001E690A53|nr:ATP-dependent DNA helicase PIF1-like [Trifolium pratense]
MPNHRLKFKLGVPVIVLRNLDISIGLCNDTRLIVTKLGATFIGAEVVNGPHNGEKVSIHRMTLEPPSSACIIFQRRQFPLCVCFAMTINKSQGQTLSNVGVYLPIPVRVGTGQARP